MNLGISFERGHGALAGRETSLGNPNHSQTAINPADDPTVLLSCILSQTSAGTVNVLTLLVEVVSEDGRFVVPSLPVGSGSI